MARKTEAKVEAPKVGAAPAEAPAVHPANGHKRAPEGETKRGRFVRLATQRVNRALRLLELIGNLSASSYEYGPDDVEVIEVALREHLDKSIERFKLNQREEGPKVTFHE